MNLLLNIIWLICGGFLICVEYIVSSLLLMITIVGIPFGFQTLKLSMLALCPFGREIRSCPGDGGCLSVLMNIIWILVGGIWISLKRTKERKSVLLSSNKSMQILRDWW